jgi:hypothetical protein
MISRNVCVALLASALMPSHISFASLGCASDITNNHLTNVEDLLMVIDNWGACPAPCAADVAPVGGNGMVDVADLLAVINNWGACPCLALFGCVSANSIWCEDFELGNYSRWTGGYSASGVCRTSAFNASLFISPMNSQRSQVFCVNPNDSHRGYGGLRFQGDAVLPSFTIPSSGGINAPNGVVVQFNIWLNVPYAFSPTKWLSLMTATHDCSNNWDQVVTLNLDDATRRLKPVHVSSVTYAPGAPAVPLQQWARVTVYLNYSTGSMHVWQNGVKVVSATFTRPITTICQWHWGLYASGNNDDIVLHEDSIRILKLQQPLTNFTIEPWMLGIGAGCTN